MTKRSLKQCTITEQELVEIFGTKRQKDSYKKNGRFIGHSKETLLKEANRYGRIEDLGDRKYQIEEVYRFVIPKNFSSMNTGLYQYTTPLILQSIIEGHGLELTTGKWARHIRMVNENYPIIKYNMEKASEHYDIQKEIISEFYSKADDMIETCIKNTLIYLKAAGAIIWREVFRVHTERIDEKPIFDKKDHVSVIVHTEDHPASEEEMEIYSQCIKVADNAAGITSESERYYGQHAADYSYVLAQELSKHGIKYIYKTYEAYYVHLDKCLNICSLFKPMEQDKRIEELTEAFTKRIMENTDKRYEKVPWIYPESYTEDFLYLCEITIKTDAENVSAVIGRSKRYTADVEEMHDKAK